MTAIVFSLACALSLVGCSPKTKTFEIADAVSLTAISGTTGGRVTITAPEDITYITDNINALTFSRGGKVRSSGWSYSLCWADETGSEIERMTLLDDGYSIIYHNHYYTGMAADYEIDLSFFDRLFAE